MQLFSFMRKPLKPFLYGTLLTLLCTIALIFFLQYQTDSKTLNEWVENYTYTGTIYPDISGQALLTPLPSEAQTLLKEADTIQSLHSMQTYAAKLTDGHLVVDHMMTLSQLQQHYFVQAKIIGRPYSTDIGSLQYDQYSIQVLKEWGSEKIGDRGLTITLYRLADEAAWEPGQELFFISDYVFGDAGAVKVVSFEIFTPAARELLTGQTTDNVFYANPFLLLNEGEGEKEILDFMEQTGIAPLYNKFAQIADNLTVHTIDDFYTLPKTATNRIYLVEGRALTASDAGKKVCMVSQNLASRNRYMIGDTVTLSIADESYSLNGWENGNPMPDDDLITSYAPAEEYEIIGFYNQIGRNASDPLYYSHTDIFIPAGEKTEEISLPYAFSFLVSGLDYDAFQEKTLPLLEATGCRVQLTDTGWQNVEDTYFATEVRCKLMFWCAILAFFVAAIVFSVLLFFHLRKEYGLSRLMGAYQNEARRVYLAAIAVIAVPSLILAGIISQLVMKTILPVIFLLLLGLLAVISFLLSLFLAISEHGSLRKIII